MNNQSVSHPIARRLNVVFRDFDLPMCRDAETAIKQAERQYCHHKRTSFWIRCKVAMDEMTRQEAIEFGQKHLPAEERLGARPSDSLTEEQIQAEMEKRYAQIRKNEEERQQQREKREARKNRGGMFAGYFRNRNAGR